jgi:hypothetical protein
VTEAAAEAEPAVGDADADDLRVVRTRDLFEDEVAVERLAEHFERGRRARSADFDAQERSGGSVSGVAMPGKRFVRPPRSCC